MAKARLDIKIDEDLKAKIQEYAKSRSKTVTSLIVDHFHHLLEQESEEVAEPL